MRSEQQRQQQSSEGSNVTARRHRSLRKGLSYLELACLLADSTGRATPVNAAIVAGSLLERIPCADLLAQGSCIDYTATSLVSNTCPYGLTLQRDPTLQTPPFC